MQSSKQPREQLAQMNVPRHVAVIMDGNGRWARRRGLPRLEGHRAGKNAVRNIVESCLELGVRYLSLYSFSTENWNRAPAEVQGLMELFQEALTGHLDYLIENNVRLRIVGDLARLPEPVREACRHNEQTTNAFTRLDLILAVSYGGREEIVNAARTLAERALKGEITPQQISNETFAQALWTSEVPDPELLIRTSGEMRISNFFLWQSAYAEIVVCPELWPEFTGRVLERCLQEYNQRERRFGLTSEQVRERANA